MQIEVKAMERKVMASLDTMYHMICRNGENPRDRRCSRGSQTFARRGNGLPERFAMTCKVDHVAPIEAFSE
jgi:hypothetical protein